MRPDIERGTRANGYPLPGLGKRNIYPDSIRKTLNVRGDDQFNRISADLPINLPEIRHPQLIQQL